MVSKSSRRMGRGKQKQPERPDPSLIDRSPPEQLKIKMTDVPALRWKPGTKP